VTRVVMEATSDYWKPVFYLLEAHGFETWLVNARDVKHLPGRPKTDKLDAVWLAKVAERQMIRPSFVPPPKIRRLRDATRYRADLVAARTAEKQRVEKLLEDAQIKLSVVVSDIFGVSGRQMLAALIDGQRDPKVLAQLARGVMRRKITTLQEAFTGYFTAHHAFLLATMLARVDAIDADITALDERITQMAAPFTAQVRRLQEIPGISFTAACAILAEIGPAWTGFPPPPTWSPGPSSPPASRSPPGRRKATAQPGTATATWPGSSVTPPPPSPAPTRFWESGTGASPAAAAARKPSSPSAAPC
jgi:transposase